MVKMVKNVLISGCSSGIGLYLAKALTDKGFQVLASCRQTNDVNHLIDMGIQAIELDVSDDASIHQAIEQAKHYFQGRLDVLINNAGYGQAGALEDISRDLLIRQFQTNVFGLHQLTRQVIPLMLAQGHGRIINISSILGLVSLPFRGAYNASKYAVEGLTDSLRLELESSGIWVCSVQPGAIDSQFRDTVVDKSLHAIDLQSSHFQPQYQFMLQNFKQQKKNARLTRGPEVMLKPILHAMEAKKPKTNYVVTSGAKMLYIARKILPNRWLHYLLTNISKNELGGKTK